MYQLNDCSLQMCRTDNRPIFWVQVHRI